jgi:hypothetical protein
MTKTIKQEDERLTYLIEFAKSEGVGLSTLTKRKRQDPSFPKRRFGVRYWRPDLLAYLYGAKAASGSPVGHLSCANLSH